MRDNRDSLERPISQTDLEAAAEEWRYVTGVSEVTGRETSASIPCQLRFVDEVEQDTEGFHDALNDRGYASLDADPGRTGTPGRPHYEGGILDKDDYYRIKVLVFRGGVARIYPYEDAPETAEILERIVEALAAGFGSALEHDPIDHD